MLRTIFALPAQQAFFQAILMSSITFSFDAREACSSQMRSAAVLINVSTCGRGEPTAVSRDPLPARGLQQGVTTQSHFQLKFNLSSQVNAVPQEPSSTAKSGGTFTASPPDREWWQKRHPTRPLSGLGWLTMATQSHPWGHHHLLWRDTAGTWRIACNNLSSPLSELSLIWYLSLQYYQRTVCFLAQSLLTLHTLGKEEANQSLAYRYKIIKIPLGLFFVLTKYK